MADARKAKAQGAVGRNVLRKAADSDIHPAEPRTGGSASSGRASTSRTAAGSAGRATRAAGSGGGRTERA